MNTREHEKPREFRERRKARGKVEWRAGWSGGSGAQASERALNVDNVLVTGATGVLRLLRAGKVIQLFRRLPSVCGAVPTVSNST